MILKKVRYKDLENWSVKFIIQTTVTSKYDVKKLGIYIKEQKCQVLPYNYPNRKFKILGVNNKVGLFDNEIKLGEEINQNYKIVRFNWFAYNPYRINVGSIGLKTQEQKYRYISPAYVVFSVIDRKQILPEYLYLIFKTKTFLHIIKNNTKGSVRQILSFDILGNLKIPLPDVDTQKKLIEKYQRIKNKLDKLKKEYSQLLEQFEKELFIVEKKEKKSLFQRVKYKDLENWSVKSILKNNLNYNPNYPLVKLGEILKRDKTQIEIQDDTEYKRVKIKLYNGGIFLRDKKLGKEIGTKKQFLIKKGQFLLSKIDARNGAFGIVPDELDGAVITGNFWTYNVDYSKVEPLYLILITTTKQFIEICNNASSGTTGRHYLQEDIFLNTKIPLPDINIQKNLVQSLKRNLEEQKDLENKLKKALEEFEKEIFE